MQIDVCIVGGGIAGVFSSFYLKRFSIDSIIVEKKEIGGLIRYANCVENFPFLKPSSGIEITQKIKEIVFNNSLKFLMDNVIGIKYNNDLFEIETSLNKTIYSKYLILATGTIPFIPDCFKNVIGFIADFEDRFFHLYNMEVCIIGGGDIAFDYALSLAKRNNKITIISRNIRAFKLLVDDCIKSGIKIFNNSTVKSIRMSNKKFNVEFCNKDNISLYFDYIIPACGRVPYYGDIKNIDKIIDENILEKKFFLCGDVKNKRNRYLVNSVSDAINISLKIKEFMYEGNC